MTEQFDIIQQFNLTARLLTAAGTVLLGVLLEFGLRFGMRWALSRKQGLLTVILNSLFWQPLLWGFLFGLRPLVQDFLTLVADQPRDFELAQPLLLISGIIIIVRFLSGWLRLITVRAPSASVSLLHNLLVGTGTLLVVVILVGYLFNVATMALLIVIAGSVTGLAVVFQEPLNNLVSGVTLTVSNRLNPNDFVRLPSGNEGTVVDIQWDVTTVQQLMKGFIVVPNSTMTQAEIINFDRSRQGLLFNVEVGVSYSSDLEHVERVTAEVAENLANELTGGLLDSKPLIRFTGFGESSISFRVWLPVRYYVDQFVFKHMFIKRLHQRFRDEGIVIPFPIRTLHVAPDSPLVTQRRPAAGDDTEPARTAGV
jgi:small-conductance mechanosensitive channel